VDVTLDEYVAWAAGAGPGPAAGEAEDGLLLEVGLGFAREIGEAAAVAAAWLADGEPRREQLADELGDVAYYTESPIPFASVKQLVELGISLDAGGSIGAGAPPDRLC
jgi:hypothetical protein